MKRDDSIIQLSLFLLFMMSAVYLFSQKSANDYFNLADSLRIQNQFDLAEKYYDVSDSLFRLEENWRGVMKIGVSLGRMDLVNRNYEAGSQKIQTLIAFSKAKKISGLEVASCYNILGAIAGEKESAYSKALSYHLKAMDELQSDTSGAAVNTRARTLGTIGTCYEHIGDYDAALENYHAATGLLQILYGKQHIAVAIGHRSKAEIYYLKGHFLQSVESYNLALQIYETVLPKVHPLKLTVLLGQGDNYLALGDYNQALESYIQAEIMSKQLFGAMSADAAFAYHKQGNVYEKKGDLVEALNYFLKAKSILTEVFGKDKSQLQAIHSDISSVYMQLGNIEKALENERLALAYNLKLYHENHFYIALNYRQLGNIVTTQREYQTAHNYFLKALAILQHNFDGKHPEIGNTYLAIGNLKKQENDFKGAMEAFHEALKHYNSEFNQSDYYQMPEINQVAQRPQILEAIYQKMDLLFQAYKKSEEPKYLQHAFEHAQFGIDYIDYFIRDFKNTDSKNFWLEKAFPLYELAMEIAYTFYQKNKNEKAFWQAFTFAESSKSNLLLQHLQNTDALIKGGVDDVLIESEKAIKQDLNFYTYLLEQSTGIENPEKTELWKQKIFELKKQYRALLKKMETNFPRYFELKYAHPNLNHSNLQNNITQPSSLLVSFFLGDKNLHVFSVHQSDIQWYSLPIDSSFFDDVQNFLALVTNQEKWLDQPEMSCQKLIAKGYFLYEVLLKKALQNRSTDIDHLNIIPDGILGYLPFELLITDTVVDQKTPSYLLKKYSIRYLYQSGVLPEDTFHKSKSSYLYLGFASSYTNNNNQTTLISLPNTVKEVETSRELWSGKSFLENEATEFNFKQTASDSRILHLALHAQLNDQRPQYSKFIFEPSDSPDDNFLHTFEIFDLPLRAELAVLSACNTGLGKIQRGEGIMSLARGFAYAGVPSISMSLWEVSDVAAGDIVLRFFQYLKDGMEKPEALQLAKLDYLNHAAPALTPPYYWGSLILLGDATPIDLKKNHLNLNPIWIAAVLLMGFFILVFRLRVKDKR